MANVIGIVDPEHERRRQFIDAVKPRLKIFNWLHCDEVQHGDTHIAWAAIPSAPVSQSRNAEGVTSFVMGDFGDNDGTQITNADLASRLAKERGVEALAGQNGFYLACMWDASNTLTLGTDILGLFPLYYYSTDRFLLFSTMYSLFRCFPHFSPEINPHGLAGILLTMHIMGEQTLFKNVRRLPVGHMLRWQAGKGSSEIPIEKLRPSSIYFEKTYSENLDIFDSLLRKSLSKTAASHKALLLSGGLDSRLLAGYLSTTPISDPVAVSLGNKADNEVRFAARVSKTLGWSQLLIDVKYSRFPEFARKLVEIEQVSNGFADLAFFQAVEDFHRISPQIMTGFAGDIVMGGSHVRTGYDGTRQEHSFKAKFKAINQYGFSPDRIRQLVRPDLLGSGLEEAIEDLENAYNSIEGLPFQRTWMFDMNHRVRFHTAASITWRLSFGSWPIMPYIDKEIMTAAFGMPEDALAERRIQIDLLCRHFPSLASLPLERLTLDTSPLLMPFYRKWIASMMEKSRFQQRKHRAMKLLRMPNYEARFYNRTFDVNNAGWSAVREDAEQYRKNAERIFYPEALKELLPPPNVPIHGPKGAMEDYGRKLLLALTLWAGENI